VRDGAARLEARTNPPPGVVHVIECDDIFASPGDASTANMSDGASKISLDLVRGMPPLENGWPTGEPRDEESAPLSLQARLYYEGCVAKGVWEADPDLPERTILVGRQSQLKVDARPGFAASGSLEVIRTFERPKRVRLDVYLVPLLEVAAGERKADLHGLVLELQRREAKKYLDMSGREIARAVQRQAVDRVLHEREHEACRPHLFV